MECIASFIANKNHNLQTKKKKCWYFNNLVTLKYDENIFRVHDMEILSV